MEVSLQFGNDDAYELAMGEFERHGSYTELIQFQDHSAVLCLRTIHDTLALRHILLPRYVSDDDLKDLPTTEILDSENHQIGRIWTSDRVHIYR